MGSKSEVDKERNIQAAIGEEKDRQGGEQEREREKEEGREGEKGEEGCVGKGR